MTTKSESESCFARETIAGGEPSHGWDLMTLEQYAQGQHEAIVGGETTLAPAYWRLGRSLELLIRKRGRKAWGKYLESLGIHRVRACKARAIARHFATADAVANIPVEHAYEQGKRRHAQQNGRVKNRVDTDHSPEAQDTVQPEHTNGIAALEAFLSEVSARADELIDTASFAELEQRQPLLPIYRTALQRLQLLGQMLGIQAEPPGQPAGNESQF